MSDIIDRTIAREGGYVDHPNDPGGATKFGITRATLSRWVGRQVSDFDVEDLQYATARRIYHDLYLRDPGFDLINDAWLREVLFDAGVLWGTRRARIWLQKAAGVKRDGIIGPKTLAAVHGGDPLQIGIDVIVSWLRRHGDRVQSGKSSPDFIGGWINRASQHLLDMPLSGDRP